MLFKTLFTYPLFSLKDTLGGFNDFLWTYILVAVLLGCAVWFTLRTRGVQFRMIGEMFRLLGGSRKSGYRDIDRERAVAGNKKKISSFQAFAVSLASSVGTGNLAGVAIAIATGGPGAVFWMWLIALIGAATAFVEATLAQLFKQRSEGGYIGGPAYYIRRGLKSPFLAALFAVLLTITFGLSYNSIQSNTIGDALVVACKLDTLLPYQVNLLGVMVPAAKVLVGAVLAALCFAVVFGGIKRIAKVSSVLVPFMALAYLALALFVIIRHLDLIPSVFSIIFENAFGFQQVAGGGLGATMMIGIKRGLFSNEAGEGSAPNVAATADVSHPVKQGLMQALGVFVDTLVVCSCTAFIILFSGTHASGELNGIALTQAALENEVGRFGTFFIAAAIFLFAFSSIIGNYYYGEANIRFLTKDRHRWILWSFRALSGGLIVFAGVCATLDAVWIIGDICMGLLTLVNIFAIVQLGKFAFRLFKDYRRQRKEGKDPIFQRSQMPEADIDCWDN